MAQPASSTSTQPIRARDREERRRILLEAAETVFAERGFAHATMAEIAGRAGYSAGNLYNVFENKDALFGEVLASRGDLILQRVRDAIAASAEVSGALDRVMEAIFGFVEEHHGFFVILSQTSHDYDWHHTLPGGSDVREKLDETIEQLFARAIERSEIELVDPASCATLFQATLNRHIGRWARRGDDTTDVRTGVEGIRKLLWRAFGLSR